MNSNCVAKNCTITNRYTTMDTKALHQKILDLATHGKLVPYDLNDEPASILLEQIKAEKEWLIKEGKSKGARSLQKLPIRPIIGRMCCKLYLQLQRIIGISIFFYNFSSHSVFNGYYSFFKVMVTYRVSFLVSLNLTKCHRMPLNAIWGNSSELPHIVIIIWFSVI